MQTPARDGQDHAHGQAVTLYRAHPLRVIHSDTELWRPVARRSARIVPRWEAPTDVDAPLLGRVLTGLRRL
jgi:hypothetical protein